jgi:hypothetical protein
LAASVYFLTNLIAFAHQSRRQEQEPMKRLSRFTSRVAIAWGLTGVLCTPVSAQIPATCGVHLDQRYNVVAVSWDNRNITLAVKGTDGWRTRDIPLKAGFQVASLKLSSTGTQAQISFQNHAETTVDLSRLVLEIPEIHRKPGHRLDANDFADADARLADPELGKTFPRKQWLFFKIRPEARLYAPVLEFAKSEPVRPASFEVWDLLPMVKASGDARYHKLFEEYRRRRFDTVVYGRVCSYPGSWLYQYWLYYPFDFGFGGHLHDSEHFFVEVDKLGGTVRQLIGAGHGILAANGIYQTFDGTSLGLELPLFVFVELGKHATAPDVDGNGFFTPGLDINAHLDAAKIWGVRDTLGTTDSQLRPYETAMTVPRRPVDRLPIKRYASLFPVTDEETSPPQGSFVRPRVEEVHPTLAGYELLPLDVPSGIKGCAEPTTPCARSKVALHTDLRTPQNMLKASLFPSAFMRMSVGLEPTVTAPGAKDFIETTATVILGAGVEVHELLARLSPKIPPLPGRITGDVYFGSVLREDEAGNVTTAKERAVTGWAIRYETLFTNLYGAYYGWRSSSRSDPRYESTPGYGARLGIGILAQMPIPRTERMSVQIHEGLAVDVLFGLSNEFRIGAAVRLGKAKQFGLDRKTASPYNVEPERE